MGKSPLLPLAIGAGVAAPFMFPALGAGLGIAPITSGAGSIGGTVVPSLAEFAATGSMAAPMAGLGIGGTPTGLAAMLGGGGLGGGGFNLGGLNNLSKLSGLLNFQGGGQDTPPPGALVPPVPPRGPVPYQDLAEPQRRAGPVPLSPSDVFRSGRRPFNYEMLEKIF